MSFSDISVHDPTIKPQRPPADEREALIRSLMMGWGHIFMHIESGTLYIVFAKGNMTTMYDAFGPVRVEIPFHVIGERSPEINYFLDPGNPYLKGFEYIGEYAHMSDPGV